MKRILITGGAGFIGRHATDRFAARHQVTVLDDLSRRGSRTNLEWLSSRRDFAFLEEDVRDAGAMLRAVERARPDIVLHLAAQVAVTTSIQDPRHDFEVNALGTFNLLEAARHKAPEALFIYASTNKVYGGMEEVGIVLDGQRYQYANLPHGAAEDQPLDFHSPYGCSKGAGDQYVRDYARIYGLRTVVFRQSCIYGTCQFGVEDQGWLAWFAICAALDRRVTIYGDGMQVRDVLWVDDLLDAYEAAIERAEVMRGRVYNIGGGPANQMSLLESLSTLERLVARPVERTFGPSRAGDQLVFVADTRLVGRELGWRPRVSPQAGIEQLLKWTLANRELFR
jgi:CDP-paratose 2-epimerase